MAIKTPRKNSSRRGIKSLRQVNTASVRPASQSETSDRLSTSEKLRLEFESWVLSIGGILRIRLQRYPEPDDLYQQALLQLWKWAVNHPEGFYKVVSSAGSGIAFALQRVAWTLTDRFRRLSRNPLVPLPEMNADQEAAYYPPEPGRNPEERLIDLEWGRYVERFETPGGKSHVDNFRRRRGVAFEAKAYLAHVRRCTEDQR